MKVLQHTRNERNLFFKLDLPDRFNGDSLLIYDNACRPAICFYRINIFSDDIILLFALRRHLCCMPLPLRAVVVFSLKGPVWLYG